MSEPVQRLVLLPLLAAILGLIAVSRPAAASAGTPRDGARGRGCTIAIAGNGAVTASIADTPLHEVIAELSRSTGAEVIWIGRPSEERLTLSIRDLPLANAVGRILSGRNHTILFSRDTAGRQQVQLRIGSAAAGRAPAPDSGGDQRRGHAARRAGEDGGRGAERAFPQTSPGEALFEALAELGSTELESAARSEVSLRPLAIELLQARAERDMSAYVALDRLSNDADDPSLGEIAVRALDDLELAARERLAPEDVIRFERLFAETE